MNKSSAMRPRTYRMANGPRLLGDPVTLFNARRGLRVRLVAANHQMATLSLGASWPRMSTGTRLTLDGREGGMGPVQFHLQVMRDVGPTAASERRFVEVRWVLITATEKRIYLVDVLRDVLGVDARLMTLTLCGEDVLGPHRKLLFEADKQRVRLINVGESILPVPGRPVEASTPSRAQAGPLDGKRTQPGIVISTLTD